MLAARRYIMVSAITLVVMAGRLGFTDRPVLLQAMVGVAVGLGLILFMLLALGIVIGLPSAAVIFLIAALCKAFQGSAPGEPAQRRPVAIPLEPGRIAIEYERRSDD